MNYESIFVVKNNPNVTDSPEQKLNWVIYTPSNFKNRISDNSYYNLNLTDEGRNIIKKYRELKKRK